MNINPELEKYIKTQILPKYNENDNGHGIDHIIYVINRSLKFAQEIPNINYDMVYTIAAYHDIGHSIDAKNHEKVSSELLVKDEGLKKFFTDEEILIMADAVYDHRASLEYEPRNIYGKIVSSADRNTLVEVSFRRTYEYSKKHFGNVTLKQIIDESYDHLLNKFSKKGYATEKMYFEDLEYKTFLEDLEKLLENRSKFDKRYIQINGLEKEFKKMREIKIGNIYKHFKNKYYMVIDIVNDCESNNDVEYQKIVIYKALYGEFLTWARPYDMFASEVEHDKYPDIKQKYRFEEVKIENEKLNELQQRIQEHNKFINSKAIDLCNYINSLQIKKYIRK